MITQDSRVYTVLLKSATLMPELKLTQLGTRSKDDCL